MSAASAIRAGRALAEKLMVDTCVATRRGVQIYAGSCRLQTRTARMTVNAALENYVWNIDDAMIQVPLSTPDLLDGDVLTITGSQLNPHLVGKSFRVGAIVPEKTHETKRVVICTELTETFLGDSITVLHAPIITDAYGNRTADWDHASSTVLNAFVQPRSSTEVSRAERDQVVSNYEVWVAPDASVSSRDRVQYAGLTWSVDGEPLVVHGTSGQPHHKTFTMTTAKG